jgi:hypothetical protein
LSVNSFRSEVFSLRADFCADFETLSGKIGQGKDPDLAFKPEGFAHLA